MIFLFLNQLDLIELIQAFCTNLNVSDYQNRKSKIMFALKIRLLGEVFYARIFFIASLGLATQTYF
jgi:hypothetical protein